MQNLPKKALKLGATSLDYSNRKNSTYFVILKDGKKVHFGNPNQEDYLLHEDGERRKKFHAWAKKNKKQSWGINLGEYRVSKLLERAFALKLIISIDLSMFHNFNVRFKISKY